MENINNAQNENIKSIKDKLTNNGWNIDAEYQSGIYFSKDRFLGVVSVFEKDNAPQEFHCRVALKDTFDKWSNSGSEMYMKNENDVVEFYSNEDNFVYAACRDSMCP